MMYYYLNVQFQGQRVKICSCTNKSLLHGVSLGSPCLVPSFTPQCRSHVCAEQRYRRRWCRCQRLSNKYIYVFSPWRYSPTRTMASSFLKRFLDHSQWRITVGRTPLNEWSARRRDLYLTTHNTHNRLISMPPAEFEPTISVGERPHTWFVPKVSVLIFYLNVYWTHL